MVFILNKAKLEICFGLSPFPPFELCEGLLSFCGVVLNTASIVRKEVEADNTRFGLCTESRRTTSDIRVLAVQMNLYFNRTVAVDL